MAKLKSPTLTIVALVLLALAAGVFASAGRWQLSRAQERRAIAAEIDAGRKQAPLAVTGATPAQELVPWRPARVEGTWRNDLSLLLDNRNLDGKPGLWLATPLQLADGSAVLVLRGWFARPMMGQGAGQGTAQGVGTGSGQVAGQGVGAGSRQDAVQSPQQVAGQGPVQASGQGVVVSGGSPGPGQGPGRVPTPAGVQSVTGELSAHVPRLFELWTLSGTPSGALPADWSGKEPAQPGITNLDGLVRVQNLDIARLEAVSGLKFVPAVLLQKNDAGDSLTREWPEPSVDSDKNVGYAMQWFAFAGIAVIAGLGVALRAWRRRAQTAK